MDRGIWAEGEKIEQERTEAKQKTEIKYSS